VNKFAVALLSFVIVAGTRASAAQSIIVPCVSPAVPIVTGLTTPSYTDLSVVDGFTYGYVVVTTDANGNSSGCTGEATATGIIPATGSHTVSLTWNASTGGTSPYTYAVFRTSPPNIVTGLTVKVN
jgi:hypothetical protein